MNFSYVAVVFYMLLLDLMRARIPTYKLRKRLKEMVSPLYRDFHGNSSMMTFIMIPHSVITVHMIAASAKVLPTLNQCTTDPKSLIEYLKFLGVQGNRSNKITSLFVSC